MGKELAIVPLFFGVFFSRICFLSSLNTSTADESSLLALKADLNSDILSKNWSVENPHCTWVGVLCSRRHSRVTGLDLSNMGLRGTIAREIGNISFLTFLDMSNNSIHGPIPGEIGNLRRLRVLNMAFNQLSDRIPDSLGLLREVEGINLSNNHLNGDIPTSLSTVGFGNLSQLQEFVLSNNQLTGELPLNIFNISFMRKFDVGFNLMSGSVSRDICNKPARNLEYLSLHFNQFGGEILSSLTLCHSLRTLSLGGNGFTGNIPNDFRNLSAIQMVGLGRNGFTGTIPHSISNLSNLMVLDMQENSFHGTVPLELGQVSGFIRLSLDVNKFNGEVPQSLFNLTRIQILSLSSNNLSGTLPFSIGRGLPDIEYLFLDDNNLFGEIPHSISNLSALVILELSNNSLAGNMPTILGNLGQLQKLSLTNNKLTNNVSKPEEDFLSPLANCKYLQSIHMGFNPISGVLPKSLGSLNLSESLQQFTAQSCRLKSPLPDEIGNLSKLVWLNLGYNELTGAVPATWGYLRNLQRLELYGNRFEGQDAIFHVLCNLRNLYYVDLRENSFFGQVPSCLGNLSMLREINLAHNKFNFSIPATLWSNEWFQKINFSRNRFDGSLAGEIGNMKKLIELDLSGNQISGEIPSTVSQLQSLTYLSLSDNKMRGMIAESFADLKDLQYLDLSCNKFSGPIPMSFEALSHLTYFNVSFNELSGKVPDKGPFANFRAEAFQGNKGLCGAPRFGVEECQSTTPTSSRKIKYVKYILPAIGALFFSTLIVIFVLRNRCVNLSPSSFCDSPVGQLYERISYHEVLDATSKLGEENLIGRGSFSSVYKGDFSDATVVAIKVFNLDVQGALKSFDVECQIMRNVRHRNLVKVITSCSNTDFKALVMPYMPNGNLERWLYSPSCSLNIFERMGILTDVASAIIYLHEGFTFPIVHCDLKPSNILLDEDMVGRVSDFGISKLLTRELRMQQTKTLGTVGYMAPEYGSDGLISTAVDVYSYGILVMEIFSRRKPTDEMFSGELTMKRWVSKSFPRSVVQIIDDDLLNIYDESTRARNVHFLTSIIQVALDCTADLPEERPTMKDVLARISKIELILQE